MPSVAALHSLGGRGISLSNRDTLQGFAGGAVEDNGAMHWMPHAHGLASATSVNETAILAIHQRHVLHVTVTVASSISLLAAIIAVYWFCKMRKNFRRGLILLLFIGDFFKSFWLLLYSCYAMRNGGVASESGFCQASGYLLQVSLELCDCAILLISIHMYLQIFPLSANHRLGRDGLYQVRHWAYAAWFVIPNITALLAFANPEQAYIQVGAFCWLPLRPIWFRLALSWIPRYLIWLFLMGVALRIYFYAGKTFKIFGQMSDVESRQTRTQPPSATPLTRISDNTTATSAFTVDNGSASTHSRTMLSPGGGSLPPPGVVYSSVSRRSSTPDWTSDQLSARWPPDGSTPAPKSLPSSRRGSRQHTFGGSLERIPSEVEIANLRQKGNFGTTQSSLSGLASQSPPMTPLTATFQRGDANADSDPDVNVNCSAMRMVVNRKQAVQRQLRMLFLYPVVYIALWLFPFINHCLNYSDYYAQNPVFAISFLNVFCQAIMGFVDVCVFSTREKPWRHIAGNDDTFWGSFCFWRHGSLSQGAHRPLHNHSSSSDKSDPLQDSSQESTYHAAATATSRPGQAHRSARRLPVVLKKVEGWRSLAHRDASSGSVRHQLEVERAQERLAMERIDRQARQKEADQQRGPSDSHVTSPTREWWDAPSTSDLLQADTGSFGRTG